MFSVLGAIVSFRVLANFPIYFIFLVSLMRILSTHIASVQNISLLPSCLKHTFLLAILTNKFSRMTFYSHFSSKLVDMSKKFPTVYLHLTFIHQRLFLWFWPQPYSHSWLTSKSHQWLSSHFCSLWNCRFDTKL